MRIKDWLVSVVAISVPGIMALPEPQGLGKRATGEHEIAQSSRAKRAIDPIITSLVGVGALGTLAGAGVLPIVTGHVDNIAETIETKRRRDAGKPSKFQKLLSAAKTGFITSLRRAYYGDRKAKRVAAHRSRVQQKRRQGQARGFLRFFRNRVKSRLFAPMVRGVKRIIRDEKQFRRVLATKNASRARALASASSSRSLARRKPFSRDGSISLRCYHNPKLRGCRRQRL